LHVPIGRNERLLVANIRLNNKLICCQIFL
jgi:hypothetical protein